MEPFHYLLLIALAAAGAVGLLTVAVHRRFTYTRRVVQARLAPSIERGVASSVLRARPRSQLPFLALLPFSPEATERLKLQLEQAGWPIRPGEFLALRLACACIAAVVAVLATMGLGQVVWLRALAVGGLTVGGWLGPPLFLNQLCQRRLERIEKQLPDALTAMAKALRAGSGILQALEYAASETPPPLGPELAGVMRDLQMGADAEAVFRDLLERVGSTDLDIAITGIVIQRTVGGNLSEILNQVTNTIRERAELQGEIRTLTSQQRLSANMAALLPVLVAAAVIAMRPDYGSLLITNPIGNIALAAGIGFELLGVWLIHKLAVIEV